MTENVEKGRVTVEFFGPFRAFGKGLELELEGEVAYDEFLERLVSVLGESFKERAEKKNTTFILNRKVVGRKAAGKARVRPGDTVAFALLIGGG